MFMDCDSSIPDDDELHAPHFGDGDYEDDQTPQEYEDFDGGDE